MGVDANEGAQNVNEDGERGRGGNGNKGGDPWTTQDGNGDGSEDGNESSSGDGNGDKDGNENERIGLGRAEERRRSATNRTRVVDAM